MKIIRWNPFGEKSIFDEELFNFPLNVKSVGFDLAVDLYEKDNNVIVHMQVPGIDPDKIEIAVQDHMLRVSGKREEEKETKEKNYYSKEIKRGSFERVIEIPAAVMTDKATADYKDGVLTVTMPKKASESSDKVKIVVNKK